MIMAERTFTSYDPLAYKVNNVSDLDVEVVKAHRNKDQNTIKQLTKEGHTAFNVYICVNRGWHAFVLCVPNVDSIDDPMDIFKDMPVNDPYAVPDRLLCWLYELCFESEELKMYKIKKEFSLFRDVKEKVKRTYFIGRYSNVHARGLQFAALAASPNRYSVLLDDCVEFAKAFCQELLCYCSNWKALEGDVMTNIQKATATGLSVEKLSRRIQSSAVLGNSFLGGMDVTSLVGQRGPTPFVIAAIIVCNIVLTVITTVSVVYFMKQTGLI